MGKHNRRRSRTRYAGRHRVTYVKRRVGKKISGVIAFSTLLSLTPTMLGYEVPGLPDGMAVIPPIFINPPSAVRGEVITDIPDEEPPVDL